MGTLIFLRTMILCVLRINKDEETEEGESGGDEGTRNEDDRMPKTSMMVRLR